ncbi:alcohol dehydrogenase [Nocardioides sp. Soil797]|nr:alcohol dehydrogenase [Nocardioides sp. Soil797]
MRAAVSWEAGAPFRVQDDVERRDPGPGEVVVRIRAAGVCQTDMSLSKGKFGQTMPVILGHEGAGEVLQVGPGVTSSAVGDRVLLTWVPACGHCYFCVRGQTYICATRKRSSDRDVNEGPLSAQGQSVMQGLGTATFAEEALVPAHGVLPIPDDLPYEYAALLGCAVPTGLGAALNTGKVTPGESVMVIGCGAVGLSAVQGARAGGGTVVAVDPQASRRALALELGATEAFAPDDPRLNEPRNGVGFDVAIDAVAHSSTIRQAWDAVRRGGRLVVVGAGAGDDMLEFSAQELFHDQKSLLGSYYGSSDMRRELPRMVELWRSGLLHLDRMVDGIVPLDDINDVVRRQASGEVLRVVVTP